jgi:hypothetical protein
VSPFEVYSEYIALQQHFRVDKYDYFRYKGRIRTSEDAFEARNDRYSFVKLSRHSDPTGLILSNIVDGSSDYIGTIASETGNKVYLSWLKRREALAYTFKSELGKLQQESFLINLRVDNGKQPHLLRLYNRKQVSIETFVIIDALTGCFDHWNTSINDPIIWPDTYKKCSKYSGFLKFDRDKMFTILRDRFT